MDFFINFWNSMDNGMKCALAFMIWLLIVMVLANAGASAGRRY